MNRDDIIRMAREAGLVLCGDGLFDAKPEELERFAALIKQHLISTGYRKCAEGQRTTQFCGQLEAAVAAEREACARVCEARYMGDNNREDMEAKRCAEAIRARGEE